jgi:predicted permease
MQEQETLVRQKLTPNTTATVSPVSSSVQDPTVTSDTLVKLDRSGDSDSSTWLVVLIVVIAALLTIIAAGLIAARILHKRRRKRQAELANVATTSLAFSLDHHDAIAWKSVRSSSGCTSFVSCCAG